MRKPTLEEIRRARIIDRILYYHVYDPKLKTIFFLSEIPQKEIVKALNLRWVGFEKGYQENINNLKVTPETVSKTLGKLERDGIIIKEPYKTPGKKGPAENRISIKQDYETLHKILKEYYYPPFNPKFKGLLGINLINSTYCKHLLNMLLMSKINDELKLSLNLKEMEAALKILRISSYALFNIFEIMEKDKEKDHVSKTGFFTTLLKSVGENFNQFQLLTNTPVEYEIKIKFSDQEWNYNDLNSIDKALQQKEVLVIEDNSIKVITPSRPEVLLGDHPLHPPFKDGKPPELKGSGRLLPVNVEEAGNVGTLQLLEEDKK